MPADLAWPSGPWSLQLLSLSGPVFPAFACIPVWGFHSLVLALPLTTVQDAPGQPSLLSWAQFSHLCSGILPSTLAPTASCRSVSGGRCLLRQQTWGNRFHFLSFPIPVLEEPTYVGPEGIPHMLGAEGAMAMLPGKCLLGGGCSPQNGAGPDQSPSFSLLWDRIGAAPGTQESSVSQCIRLKPCQLLTSPQETAQIRNFIA